MKKIFFTSTLIFIIICFSSCNRKKYLVEIPKANAKMTVEAVRKLFLDYCDNPIELYSAAEPSKKLRYIEIPLADIQTLQTALGNNFGGLRIYLGYSSATHAYHFILLGVDASYRNRNHIAEDEVFDDFKPCPTSCFSDPTTRPDLKLDSTDLGYYKDVNGVARYKDPR